MKCIMSWRCCCRCRIETASASCHVLLIYLCICYYHQRHRHLFLLEATTIKSIASRSQTQAAPPPLPSSARHRQNELRSAPGKQASKYRLALTAFSIFLKRAFHGCASQTQQRNYLNLNLHSIIKNYRYVSFAKVARAHTLLRLSYQRRVVMKT